MYLLCLDCVVAQAFTTFKAAAAGPLPVNRTPALLEICIKYFNRLQYDRDHEIKVTKKAKATLDAQVAELGEQIAALAGKTEEKDVEQKLATLKNQLTTRTNASQHHAAKLTVHGSDFAFCTEQVDWIREQLNLAVTRLTAASQSIQTLKGQLEENAVNLVRNTIRTAAGAARKLISPLTSAALTLSRCALVGGSCVTFARFDAVQN